LLLSQGVANAAIVLDYTHDTTFAAIPAAKAAIDQAAADVSAAIDFSSLTAIPSIPASFNGTTGGTSLDFNGSLSYINPTTGLPTDFGATGASVQLAAGEFRIFVGARNLLGVTVGTGGPGSGGLSFDSGSLSAIGDISTAVNSVETQANALFGRTSNVVMGTGGGTLIGSIGPSNFSESYSVSFGPTIGNLWFDTDGDNDESADTSSELAAFWHFDHTAPVAAGKTDLYSVAVHEILHAVGIGTADSWDSKVAGTSWTGATVLSLDPSVALDADQADIVSGTMSPRLSDGTMQEVAMDPSILNGTRKELTQLDVAFLRDIGWSTVAVPEPSAFLFMGLIALALGGRRCLDQIKRRFR